ncbi:hypothetical protein L3V83_11115 [Thiotrichales bacterium 19X7-9]|nr:hypothetical protein [Thiotrichales bacterium 19X7-9]
MKSSLEKNNASVKTINELLNRMNKLTTISQVTHVNVYNVLSDMIYYPIFEAEIENKGVKEKRQEFAIIFDDESFNEIENKFDLKKQCEAKIYEISISLKVYKILENLRDGDSINSNTIRSIGLSYRKLLLHEGDLHRYEKRFTVDNDKLTIAANLAQYDIKDTKTSNECVNYLIKQLAKIKNHDFFSIVSTDILNEVLGCNVKNTNEEGEQIDPKLLACEFKHELDKQKNGNKVKSKSSYLFWNRNNPPEAVEYSLHKEL